MLLQDRKRGKKSCQLKVNKAKGRTGHRLSGWKGWRQKGRVQRAASRRTPLNEEKEREGPGELKKIVQTI